MNSEVDVVVGEDGAPREAPWTWGRLVAEGLVEYVDAEEEETTMIAMHIRDLAESRWVAVESDGWGRRKADGRGSCCDGLIDLGGEG